MESGDSHTPKGQPGTVQKVDWAAAALFALCPRCGAKGLFSGVTRFAPRCPSCGLDYDQFNVGDGPAAFLTMVIGGLIVGLALWLEFTWEPPLWVHAVLWLPLVTGLTLLGLRLTKAALLVTEYQRRAREVTGSDVK